MHRYDKRQNPVKLLKKYSSLEFLPQKSTDNNNPFHKIQPLIINPYNSYTRTGTNKINTKLPQIIMDPYTEISHNEV